MVVQYTGVQLLLKTLSETCLFIFLIGKAYNVLFKYLNDKGGGLIYMYITSNLPGGWSPLPGGWSPLPGGWSLRARLRALARALARACALARALARGPRACARHRALALASSQF